MKLKLIAISFQAQVPVNLCGVYISRWSKFSAFLAVDSPWFNSYAKSLKRPLSN